MLLRHQGMVERVLEVVCERLRRTTIALEELALCDLPERLARVLSRLAQDYGHAAPGRGILIEQRLSHTDLGNLVASSRESVALSTGSVPARCVATPSSDRLVGPFVSTALPVSSVREVSPWS